MKKLTILLLFFTLATLAGAQNTKPSLNIVFDGDSQTELGTYPARILELLASAGYATVRSINYGVSGQTTSEMTRDVSSQIIPRYNSKYNENIVLYWIGANDAPNGQETNVAGIQSNLIAYFMALKSAGFKVVMINLPDAVNRTGTVLINSMYAREFGNMSNAYVNCRESGGVFENYMNATYYRDNVHLSTTGFNYLAEHYIYSQLISLINPTVTPIPVVDLQSGLTAYYRFDETSGIAVDETGLNQGTVSAGVGRGSTGKLNGAYVFDSNSDYVKLASSITLKTGSYSFWIKIAAIPDDLLILGNEAHRSRIFVGSNNNLKLETNTNGEEFASYSAFTIGTWHYVVLTREENTVKFYRNGSLIGSSTISASNSLTLSQIGFNGRSFSGMLDEVGIWSRVLTAAEVSRLYNAGSGLSFPFLTQVAVTGVSISPASATLAVGSSLSLTAVVIPFGATNKSVDWISSDAAVASVSSAGVVTGLNAGLATITATTMDGRKTSTSAITVGNMASLTSGLRVYYGFDEISGDARDAGGLNNGTVSEAVNRGSAGIIKGAYLFDSNADYVSLASAVTQKTGSYSFWIKISSLLDDLIIMGSDIHSSRIFIGSNNNLKLETDKNGEEFAFYTDYTTGTWYHVVLTRDENTVKLYRNGSYLGSSTIPLSTGLSVSQIGFYGRSFSGTIDELGIWNRVLTAGEVASLYNNGSGLAFPFVPAVVAKSMNVADGISDKDSLSSTSRASFFYPNPAVNTIHISLANTPRACVFIYDIHGKLMSGTKIEDNEVNISSLARGIYLLKLIDHNQVFINKLIIN
jgi:uncharacterized protein YjdB